MIAKRPGLNVGQLREALRDLPDSTLVYRWDEYLFVPVKVAGTSHEGSTVLPMIGDTVLWAPDPDDAPGVYLL